MPPSEEERRLVCGDGPINRRTAAKPQRHGDGPRGGQHAALQERIERVHTRNRFGTPLADQLAAARACAQKPASGAQIALGVLAACGGLAALLGAIQSLMWLVLAASAVAVVGAIAWKVVHDRANASAGGSAASASLFDSAALAAFDAALDTAAAELDEANATRLLAIKEAFKRIGQQPVVQDGHFTVEDRLYLRECLRRYVPDSIAAYLRVPVAQRAQQLWNDQPCAQVALRQQLDLLLEEICLRETKIGRSAAEQLAGQQRFLAAKKSR